MKRRNIKWPKFRFPLANPVNLHKKVFSLKGKGKKRPKITGKKVAVIFLWGLAIFVGIVVFMFAWFAKDLPTPGKIKTLVSESSTRLFDRNNNPLYTISGEKKRILIEEKDIPEHVKEATIALEDKDFYHHLGFDFNGLVRAVVYGGQRGGGSTITQQFVKNALLTSERTLVRKAKEIILAVEMEVLFTKDQILTMYLNEIPYGGNNYGIEAAAKSFFGKDAKDLTLDEAATLAALPQLPSTYSPYGQNTDLLIKRRDLALTNMKELGFITEEEASQAKGVDTLAKVVPQSESITAPHFVLYVKEWLVSYFTEELGDQQLAEQKVEEGGLTVVTTLDLPKQQEAERILSEAKDSTLKRAGASNAGLVSLDPKRGEVIAMVGSVDYYQDQFGAYNVTTGKRQPGSSFKPLVYASAFKEKYNPATTFYDLRTDFGNYIPENYDGQFRGPITIRKALGNSLNIPAVKALGLVGIDKALKTASDMGITTLTDKDRYGLSLVLGAGEVKPIEMAAAYGVFANNGTLMPTTPILKITDSKGDELYNHEDPKDGQQVLDPQIAYQITSILADVDAKRPTFNFSLPSLTLTGRIAATKTGTTNSYKDAWTIGYTPQYVTAVWAGNNDNTPMTRAGGSTAAAPLWDAYMEHVHKDLPVEGFVRPKGIQEVSVDRLSNKLPVDGSEVIQDIFASWQIPTEQDDVHKRVRVCRENGLLADNSIPDELAEYRTYTYVESEKPNNSDWENPVRAWAQANSHNNKPPTAKCDVTTDTKPTVSITNPGNSSTVSGTFTIAVSASAASGVQSVQFLIDNSTIGTDMSAPYETSYNASNLSNGSHSIAAVVTSNSGASSSTQISVTVTNDTTPPSNVTGYNGLAGPGSGKATLSWINPTNTDFKSVKIYVYIDATGVLVRTVEVAKPGINTTITSLNSGTAYKFTAKSVDTSNNESSGVNVILTPP
jgi:1A family penicillin-binding protein